MVLRLADAGKPYGVFVNDEHGLRYWELHEMKEMRKQPDFMSTRSMAGVPKSVEALERVASMNGVDVERVRVEWVTHAAALRLQGLKYPQWSVWLGSAMGGKYQKSLKVHAHLETLT